MQINRDSVAPSRVRGLKHERLLVMAEKLLVAPSRVRGLKPLFLPRITVSSRRTFTGAWIETDHLL